MAAQVCNTSNDKAEISQVVHVFNPSTRDLEAGRSLWVGGQPGLTWTVSGQPELHSETLSQTNKQTSWAGGLAQIWGQLKLQNETLSQKKIIDKEREENHFYMWEDYAIYQQQQILPLL